MKIFGNYRQQEILKSILNNSISEVIAIVGPSNIGKHSFINYELNTAISDSDIFRANHTIDSARSMTSSLLTSSIYSPFQALVIDEADNLSEPAQDAYLKLFEEPFSHLKIFLICSDDFLLLSPLHSRITRRIMWSPLSRGEMEEFITAESLSINDFAVRVCNGRPGLYREVSSSYEELYRLMIDIITNSVNPMVISTPDVIKNLSNKSIVEKDIIARVCSLVVRDSLIYKQNHDIAIGFLSFASLLRQIPSINAEIHWQRACLVF
jgi:DNA polymerase III gamma/tau subunit